MSIVGLLRIKKDVVAGKERSHVRLQISQGWHRANFILRLRAVIEESDTIDHEEACGAALNYIWPRSQQGMGGGSLSCVGRRAISHRTGTSVLIILY